MPQSPDYQRGFNVAAAYWKVRYNLLKQQVRRADTVRADLQTKLDDQTAEYDQYRIDHP